MTPLFATISLVLGAAAVVVVTTRDPLRQAINAGMFGLVLVLMMYALQAPDVALSAIVVQSIALPLMILLAVARVRRHPG